jgi:3-oxoacyl-[acyl-carrier-protein] synthase II
MNPPPVVTGAGVLCPVGAGATEALAAFRGAGPPALRTEFDFGARLSLNQRRRLDRLSQLLLCACLEAADQAGWGRIDGDRTGLVIGTGLGCLEKTESYLRGIARTGLAYADAMGFPDAMDSSPAAHVAMTLGCRGTSLTVTQREISGEGALILAELLLRNGSADAVMVAAGDAASDELVQLLRRIAPGKRAGEVAAALVLETRESAERRGARTLGSLLGHGAAGAPVAAPALRYSSLEVLARARELAFSMAGIPPGGAADVPRVAADEVSKRIGWVMADGVLRAILALDRIAAGAGPAAIVERSARGGTAAAVVFGPGR